MTTEPERPDERLSKALDQFAAPKARESFREQLRQQFAAGAGLSLEEALDTQRPAEARADFKADLRARFLEAAEEAEPSPRPARTQRPTSNRRRQRHAQPEEPRRNLRLLVGGGLAAVAAAAAVVVMLTRPEPTTPATTGSSIFVVDTTDLSMDGLQVDGEPVPADTTAEGLAAMLAGAESVRAGASPVRFLFRDQFAVEIDPSSVLDLRGLAPGTNPWVLASDGDEGAYRVATTPGFDGAAHPLEFHTDVRSVRVVGTVFGVDVIDPETVCICCNHGEVETFCQPGGPTESVGENWTLYTDQADPEGPHRVENLTKHQEPLTRLREFVDAWPAAQAPGD